MKFNNDDMVSIIVPCFNSGKTLNKTIKSIKNQTWLKKEIILVNDGSNDNNTLSILNQFKDDKVIKLIEQKNKGLASARNTGVMNAKGNYLFFLDADDWIESNTIEEMYLSLKINNQYAYIFSDCFLEGEIRGIRKKVFNLYEQLFINQIPYSIFIPRKIFVKNGFYDEDMYHGYEDWELNLRLASKNLYGKRLDKALFHYNVSTSGMLIAKSIRKHVLLWKYIKNKNKSLYEFKSVFKIFFQWGFRKTNYPLIFVLIWSFMLSYIPEFIVLYTFLTIRKTKFLMKKFSFLNK
tara:strand:- start:868 stop:1746 length:879 start_codon:yes stop_codon:yes gene_type:complete